MNVAHLAPGRRLKVGTEAAGHEERGYGGSRSADQHGGREQPPMARRVGARTCRRSAVVIGVHRYATFSIGAGGFLGAAARYLVDGRVVHHTGSALPWGTFAILFAASDDAGWVTGSTICVDGGLALH